MSLQSRPRRRLPDSSDSQPNSIRRGDIGCPAKRSTGRKSTSPPGCPGRSAERGAHSMMRAWHEHSHRLADRAAVDTIFHRDGMTLPHGGDRDCDGGWESGRNNCWRHRGICIAPSQHRAVTCAPCRRFGR